MDLLAISVAKARRLALEVLDGFSLCGHQLTAEAFQNVETSAAAGNSDKKDQVFSSGHTLGY
jgi:hypothetical protein